MNIKELFKLGNYTVASMYDPQLRPCQLCQNIHFSEDGKIKTCIACGAFEIMQLKQWYDVLGKRII